MLPAWGYCWHWRSSRPPSVTAHRSLWVSSALAVATPQHTTSHHQPSNLGIRHQAFKLSNLIQLTWIPIRSIQQQQPTIQQCVLLLRIVSGVKTRVVSQWFNTPSALVNNNYYVCARLICLDPTNTTSQWPGAVGPCLCATTHYSIFATFVSKNNSNLSILENTPFHLHFPHKTNCYFIAELNTYYKVLESQKLWFTKKVPKTNMRRWHFVSNVKMKNKVCNYK